MVRVTLLARNLEADGNILFGCRRTFLVIWDADALGRRACRAIPGVCDMAKVERERTGGWHCGTAATVRCNCARAVDNTDGDCRDGTGPTGHLLSATVSQPQSNKPQAVCRRTHR